MESYFGDITPLAKLLLGQLGFLFVMYILARAPQKDLSRSLEARKIQARLNWVFATMAVGELVIFSTIHFLA